MPGSKKVDCRGLACPQPVINVKKAMDSMGEGTLTAIVDNETAKQNVSLFAKNAGCTTEVKKDGNDYLITITRGAPAAGGEPWAIPEDRQESAPLVYFITSNLLGQGSPDLGQVLMKSLMVTLNEMSPPPEALLFLNTGVMCACQGSPVLGQLQSLSAKGTDIIACGTCLDYYKLKENLAVGKVGNMLLINEYLAGKAKVITVA